MSHLHCRKRALEPENGGTLCSKVKKIECNSDCCTDEVTAFGGSSVMLWGGNLAHWKNKACHHATQS